MMRSFRAILLASVCMACAFMQHDAFAQNVYASIHGTVVDTSGAVVPGAKVTALNTSTGITTEANSDSHGYYLFPQLQVGGPYTVSIAASGFNSFTVTGTTLNVNDNRDVDAKLEVGSSSTTVEVTGSSLQVETSDTQLKQIVTAQQLEEIPLLGRDPAGLQKLEPGVVESSDRFGSFSTNGSQTPQNAYIVDGVDINDGPLQSEGILVNPDALSEENIISSTLNPEFARNSGAIVNQIIKSGSNTFHGSGFEFYRDTFLNATPYFATAVPQFHQNLYGGTFGGPLFKNKLFFFLGYQGLRNRTGAPNSSPTLTAEDFAGNFSDDQNYNTGGTNATSGLTGNPLPFAVAGCPAGTPWSTCFPTGAVSIAPNQWNSIASTITNKFIPQPNFQGVFYNFNTTDTSAQDQGIIRLDYTPSSHDTIWASTIFQSSPSVNTLSFGGGNFPGFGEVNVQHYKIFSGAWTHTFNATTLNELRIGYYRFNYPSVEPQTPTLPSAYGFSITPQDSASPGFPYLSIGAFSLGNSYEGPQPRTDTNLTYGDNFTKIIGNHSLKLGGSYEQFRVKNPFSYLNNGYYSYAGGTSGQGAYSSGDPILDFELGIPDSYEQTSNGFIDTLAAEAYAYAQDSWEDHTRPHLELRPLLGR